jgi:hypothetical protein
VRQRLKPLSSALPWWAPTVTIAILALIGSTFGPQQVVIASAGIVAVAGVGLAIVWRSPGILAGALLSASIIGGLLWLRLEPWDGIGKDLAGRTLEGRELAGRNFADARMQGVHARGARLPGANLRNARLNGADLRDVDFRGAYLQEACLRGADLTGADLRGADLTGSDRRGTAGESLAGTIGAQRPISNHSCRS